MKTKKISFLTRFVSAMMAVCMLVLAFGTVTFAATPAADSADMYFNPDFSTWGPNGTADGNAISPSDLSTYSDGEVIGNDTNIYKIVSSTDGGALDALQIYRAATAGPTMTTYIAFDEALSHTDAEGKIVVEMKIHKTMEELLEGETASGSRYINFGFYSESDGAKKAVTTSAFSNGALTRQVGSSGQRTHNAYANISISDDDADNYYSLRFEIMKGNDTNKDTSYDKSDGTALGDVWYTDLYCVEEGTNNGKRLFGYKCSLAQLGDAVSGFKLELATNDAADPLYNTMATIKDVKIYIDKPEAVSCSPTVAYENGTANITFEEEIDSTTVSGITVADTATNTPVSCTASASGTTATLTFGELAESTEYTVTIPEKTVKTTAGVWVAAKTFTFATKSQAEADMYLDGVSTWTAGTKTADEVTSLSNGAIEGNSSYTYTVNDDGSLSINITKNTIAYFNFGKALDFDNCDGKVVFRFKLKESDYIATTGNVDVYAYGDTERNAGFSSNNAKLGGITASATFSHGSLAYNQRLRQSTSYNGDFIDDDWIAMRMEVEKINHSTNGLIWKAAMYSEEEGYDGTVLAGGYFPVTTAIGDWTNPMSAVVKGFAFKAVSTDKTITMKDVQMYLDRPEPVDESKPLFEADFTDTTKWGAVGTTYTVDTLKAKDAQLAAKSGTLQTYTVSANGLTFTPYVDASASGSSTETFNINLGTTVETGTVAAELEIKVEAAASIGRDIKFWGDSDPLNVAKLSATGDGVTISGANNWIHAKGSPSGTTIQAAATGDDTAKFIKLRLVASRASADERWNYVIYDMNDGNKPLCISISNRLSNNELETTPITAIGFSVWRSASDRQSKTGNITIKSAKVYMANDAAAAFGDEVINDSTTKTALTLNNNTATFTGTVYSRGVDQAPNKLIIAGYNASGVLVGVNVTDVNGVTLYTADAPLTYTFSSEVSYAKLMIWDSVANAKALVGFIDAQGATEP